MIGSYKFDLQAALPYENMPNDEKRQIWDDLVHFTAKGYDHVGNLLYGRLLEIIQSDYGITADVDILRKSELKKRSAGTPDNGRDASVEGRNRKAFAKEANAKMAK
jgi:hypothetical protein